MNESTYCPEDNKLRLYVGRVPRDEYLELRKEGWKSTPKQECDFVANWTPEREDRAISYAGDIGDEDQSPADRAADRAERFGDYCDKRRSEACQLADRYDSTSTLHGYQNAARAARSAARHDRIADKAVSQWSKAEYWTRRTAGVINHALYNSRPDVRMGRIKRLETERRLYFQNIDENRLTERSLRWKQHYNLRLAYENQMLQAQGGRANDIEIVAGGRWLGALIVKVNKSNVTKRVVSVQVKTKAVTGYNYRVRNVKGCDFALAQFDVERASKSSYTEPTDESMKELKEVKAAMTASKKKMNSKKPKLINPTIEDAERLQAIWNSEYTTIKMTQAKYSECSKGSYGRCETVEISEGGFKKYTHFRRKAMLPTVCKVRQYNGRVIILTDKPQKKLPELTWIDPRPGYREELEPHMDTISGLASKRDRLNWTEGQNELWKKAELAGLVYCDSMSQFGFTDLGVEMIKAVKV